MSDAPAQVIVDELARPYDPAKVVSALLGLPPRVARHVVGLELATSAEAEHLLDRMPHILRALAIATTDRPERCYGELRGPVLWSETISSRAATAGDPGLYVCATTSKAYDTHENRLLKTALDAVRRAGAEADTGTADAPHDVRRARQNGHRAGHLLEHQTLAAVPVTRVSGRDVKRTRAGSRRTTYRPAVDVLRRASALLSAELVERRADTATRAQIDVLAAALLAGRRAAASDGRTHLPLRHSHGTLTNGLVTYDHLGGVTVGGTLVTSVEQAAAAVGRASAGTAAG